MGVFGVKDRFYDKYGDVNLTENEDALIQVWADGNYDAGLKSLFLLKSFLGLDNETYQNCRKGFVKQQYDFWGDWLKAAGLDYFQVSCDYDEMHPFLLFLLDDYELYKKIGFGELIDFSKGLIYSPNYLRNLYNYCVAIEDTGLHLPFISSTVIKFELLHNCDPNKVGPLADATRLELEMMSFGLDDLDRKRLLYTGTTLLPNNIARERWNKYVQEHAK